MRVVGGSGSVGVGRRIGVPGRSVRGWGRMGVVWRRSGVRVVGGWRFCNWLRMLVLVVVFLGEGGGVRRDNSWFEAGEKCSAFTSAQRAGKNKQREKGLAHPVVHAVLRGRQTLAAVTATEPACAAADTTA